MSITKEQVAAWLERQPVTVIGRSYQKSEPKDFKAFCEWFARVADEIENLDKVDSLAVGRAPCAVVGCSRTAERGRTVCSAHRGTF